MGPSATVMALLLVPPLYLVMTRGSRARSALAQELEEQRAADEDGDRKPAPREDGEARA